MVGLRQPAKRRDVFVGDSVGNSQNAGIEAELRFELRLRELGYSPICVPCRVDEGVDFLVFSSKGWIGIQVKTVSFKKNPSTRVRYDHGGRPRTRGEVIDCGKLRTGGAEKRRRGGKSYYQRKGVSVFAFYRGTGFYLVPISETGEITVTLSKSNWEAWSEVIGLPISVEQISQEQEDDQIGQLELILKPTVEA